MSKSGKGTLLKNIRAGLRPALDPRNRLILPALDVIKRLRPRWVVFENVIEMRNTVIADQRGEAKLILDAVYQALSPEYAGEAYDVEFADHGIAQRRQRLITVLTRDADAVRLFSEGRPLIPEPTHARSFGGGRARWVSVTEALATFPPLDAARAETATSAIPFHRVPVLEARKYEWVRHTPAGRSAFDNQCIDPACRFDGNTTHAASRGAEGINRANRDTPLFCRRCGALLPRPSTPDAAAPRGVRIMSGYTSAYKRMDAGLPAPALTRNLSYPCSDQKVHPTQNRVLSLAEAFVLQTVSRYDYLWGPLRIRHARGEKSAAVAPDSLIRLAIGESVPPYFLERLGRHLGSYTSGQEEAAPRGAVQRLLF